MEAHQSDSARRVVVSTQAEAAPNNATCTDAKIRRNGRRTIGRYGDQEEPTTATQRCDWVKADQRVRRNDATCRQIAKRPSKTYTASATIG